MSTTLISRVTTYFPGSVLGADGVAISQAAGIWTVSLGTITPDGINIGSSSPGYAVSVKAKDGTNSQVLFAGTTFGIRIWQNAFTSNIEGVDTSGNLSYQPLNIAGSQVTLSIAGTPQAYLFASGGFGVGNTTPDPGIGGLSAAGPIKSSNPSSGVGYITGAGGTITQTGSRTTGVTLNKITGAITLVSAAGSATPFDFTVTNSAIAATDVVIANMRSGTTDRYTVIVTKVAAGSFDLRVTDLSGTTTEQPVINFAVIKAVTA
jgi:hypothetical protein